MSDQPTVVVAMSGGVDSSVAATLLVHQGYRVIGMMMRLWSEPGKEADNRCCTPDAIAMARRVAAILNIPFYTIDAQAEFHSRVVEYFINGYIHGVTPNPCLMCNRHIRWEFLLNHALSLGAQFMATGHYAQVRKTEDGLFQLVKAISPQKDQSYILHVMNQESLSHALFPVGTYEKKEVRELAAQYNLPVADRGESQDLCFLGNSDYRDFLARYAPHSYQPGSIRTSDGRLLGQHQGLSSYTIGQRKGLGIQSPEPLYVIAKDALTNALIVGTSKEMGKSTFLAKDVNWISGSPPKEELRAQIKIRYKAAEAWGWVKPVGEDAFQVKLDEPLRDITPGQAAVIYDGDVCLGGGIIDVEA